jgi:hypothetical protein
LKGIIFEIEFQETMTTAGPAMVAEVNASTDTAVFWFVSAANEAPLRPLGIGAVPFPRIEIVATVYTGTFAWFTQPIKSFSFLVMMLLSTVNEIVVGGTAVGMASGGGEVMVRTGSIGRGKRVGQLF